MKKLKTILTYILVVFLTIFLLVYCILSLISSKVMNENYLLSKLSELNYYQKVYNQVQSNFENYIKQSGLEEDVIKNIVTYDKVEEDTKKIINKLFSGINEEISTKDISDKLNENINKSLKNRNLSIEEQESIKKFVDIICKEYESTILHTGYENNLNDSISNITKKTEIYSKILLIGLGLSVILILLINIKKFYKFANAIGISVTSSGVTIMAISIFINLNIKIEEITLLNTEFSEFLRTVLAETNSQIRIIGIVFIIIGIAMIICSNLIHNIRKYGVKEKEEEKWKK